MMGHFKRVFKLRFKYEVYTSFAKYAWLKSAVD